MSHKPCLKHQGAPYCETHPTFYWTVVQSKQWKAWNELRQRKLNRWDTVEAQECGWISPEHFQAFLKFCNRKSRVITK